MSETTMIPEATTPRERIMRSDILANIYNPRLFCEKRKLIVDLECGHKAIAHARSRSIVCRRCTEMLRRSLTDSSEDWDAYRHRGKRDEMVWLEDPCRLFNELTDLEGNFLSE